MPVKLDFNPTGVVMPLLPIAVSDIVRMVNNYATQPRNDDTKSCWVSAVEIMALISDNRANGVRIYYGRHDATDPVYPSRHNLILVATLDQTDPLNPTPEESKNLLNFTATAGPINSVSYTGMGDDTIPLCPPRCSRFTELGA